MRKKITDAKARYIVEHFASESNAQIMAATGLSLPVIYRVANQAGVKRTNAFRRKLYGAVRIPDEKMDWFIKHFKDTENFILADELGISESTLHRLARKYGLKKSKAFMKATQLEGAAAAKYFHLKRGTYPQKGVVPENFKKGEAYRFKPGTNNLMRNGAVNERHRRISLGVSRKELYAKERRRVRCGLPQQTKLRVTRQPDEKIKARCYLKTRGYILDEDNAIAFWSSSTHRAPRLESRTEYPYKFKQLTV